MSRRAFILGGSGQIGRATALNLLDAGWDVTVGQRHGELPAVLQGRVTVTALDRADDTALTDALSTPFDAVIDTVAYSAAHARQWLALQDRLGALAVISTGSVYVDDEGRTLGDGARYPIPLREDQRRIAPGEADYSTNKVAMEDALLAGARVPLKILRPFAVHGPGSRAPREWWFLAQILRGAQTIPLAFDGQSQFHTTATANLAELTRLALEQPGVHVLNAADPEAPTVAEIGRDILTAMGSSAALAPFPGPPKGWKGRTPWSVEAPLVADMSAAAALGYRPVTDYATAAPALCAALVEEARGKDWLTAFPGLAAYPPQMFEAPPAK
ncbi:NAD-dependent epimerase/dehydratase family protein [Phenylobacterium sp. 20VBR1]|uniref:NAD-dependent epimerase/dehydratase family protein n=1 Tax=Phenylobacterium glaciei TaxID=2803784 RepID=A0A941CZY5_9CAUL|nr:NAD-dependent epimerase/dehydratase family protein [Phenylobacterium glaciei]MBR7619392.1 NAD-dependent epimerase/dehydratase family protein [Phenylobacterium glaciei]